MEKVQLLEMAMEKVGMSLTGIDSLMTASFECETYIDKTPSEVKSALSRLNGGSIPQSQKFDGVNVGNGWNSDGHQDGTVNAYDTLRSWNDFEVSSGPLKATNFADLRNELQVMYDTLAQATKLKHSVMASSHIHVTMRYGKTNSSSWRDEWAYSLKFDNKEVMNRIARFVLKYMPILKWWSMTSSSGARGSFVKNNSYGSTFRNPYDKLEEDKLFNWYDNYQGAISDRSSSYLNSMERGSYMRVHFRNDEIIHWENRMADQTASHTHMATMVAMNKAITLWAIDMARKGYNLQLDANDVETSKQQMRAHRQGYKHVDRTFIEKQSAEVISYLSKYMAIGNNLDAIKYLEKLTKCPVSEYIESKGLVEHFNPAECEKAFNERNRPSDESLRKAYVEVIDAMVVPMAKSLADFHTNTADFLGVEKTQVVSLYQMLNRENVSLRWLGNRLVIMD